VPALTKKVRMHLRLLPATFHVGPTGAVYTMLDGAPIPLREKLLEDYPEFRAAHGVRITQVIGRVHLWDGRRTVHERYLESLTPTGFTETARIPVLQEDNRSPRRRQPPVAFELSVTRRLKREFQYAISRLLLAIGSRRLRSFDRPDPLPGYFTMLAPGRVCRRRPAFSVVANGAVVTRSTEDLDLPVEQGEIQAAVNSPPIAPSDFFIGQVTRLNELRLGGQRDLAFVGLCFLLEWSIDNMLNPKRKADFTMSLTESCRRSYTRAALGKPLCDEIAKDMVPLRNAIVHSKPSAGDGTARHGNVAGAEAALRLTQVAQQVHRSLYSPR